MTLISVPRSVANSPGLTRSLRVLAFNLQASGVALQSPGYGENCSCMKFLRTQNAPKSNFLAQLTVLPRILADGDRLAAPPKEPHQEVTEITGFRFNYV